jgi:type II secretory pathway pseudopilin PulG
MIKWFDDAGCVNIRYTVSTVSQAETTHDGFTLMETLVSIAILMVISSLFVVAFSTAFKAVAKSNDGITEALTITQVDRFIRQQTDSAHIPYWVDSKPYVEELLNELYRSKIGMYIKSIEIINDSRKKPRGILVVYIVKKRRIQTRALFPAVSVMDYLK